MKFILLLSTMHTGTWWAIDTLRTHPDIKGFSSLRNLQRHINNWVLTGVDTGNPHGEHLSETGTNLVFSHWLPSYPKDGWNEWNSLGDALVITTPTISPLRDPLLSLLTAYNREPLLYPHNNILDAWCRLARTSGFPHGLPLTFFKVDLFDPMEFRTAIESVGLECKAGWMNSISPGILSNTSGFYNLKKAYKDGNYAHIRRAVPLICHNLEMYEPLLRPFLESKGYSNLMWWS